MERYLQKHLKSWVDDSHHLPLLLHGARQVGKTYLIEELARNHFSDCITINFELSPELSACFETIEPQDIIDKIYLATGKKLVKGETLLFLDEIQDCPSAITALRYFKENLPQQHVIAAGSLLDFALNEPNFKVPVGRVQYLYLKPLSFKEYLQASPQQHLVEYLEDVKVDTKIPQNIHMQLLQHVKQYMILGGMPAVIAEFIRTQDFSKCQNLQSSLLNTYRSDFGKYATRINHKYLSLLFSKLPGLVGQQFKFSNVDSEIRSRELKQALGNLNYAGLAYPVYATAASGIPLNSVINHKKFKVNFIDTGLVIRTSKLDSELMLAEDVTLINKGAIAEQLVGQELLAYFNPYEEAEVYFWARDSKSSTAEVDFVATVDANIIPIEVKAGATGRLKSLKILLEEKRLPLGVRISQHPLAKEGNVLSLPFYMIGEMNRLVREVLRS